MICGLLGRKLGHSYSPQIHANLGDYSYALFEKEPDQLEHFLKNGQFSGLNVTVPYKKSVIPYLDELSPRARELGAVNTIVRRDGKLIGHNTDYFGFAQMLQQSGLDVGGKKVLVLGSGGASNTAVAVLQEQNAQVVVISRSGENNYQNLYLHTDARVIVNTTPVGMYPATEQSPIHIDVFPHLEGVLDVIYNPARTALLRQAEERGLITANGLLMLVAQAAEASQWFTGNTVPRDKVGEIYKKLRQQMENIVLIGMPGCGKSSVGRYLAERTGKPFVDADEEITNLAGKSIPEIFAQDGETAFRDWETRALSQLGKQSGLVIATGGGCVTRTDNYRLLHQNGVIFCLDRNIDQLPVDGRPLSQSGKLEEMYALRKPLYDQFADYHIDCNGSIQSAAEEIMRIWEEMP